MFQTIYDNRQWIFSGIGVFVLSGILYVLKRNRGRGELAIGDTTNNNASTNTNNNSIVNNIVLSKDVVHHSENELSTGLEFVKRNKRILFIDDDREFKIVSTLKSAGWSCVDIIGDPKSLDEEKIKNADLLFIDVQGVGVKLGFKEQGLGLSRAIRERYSDKKIVVYSAVKGLDPFSSGFRAADDHLKKNAEFYEFETTIIGLLKK